MEQSYHYNVMRRAIAEIDNASNELSLSDLAGRLDMSPAHFQRIFSAWVGVSPKRYQQYLTLGHAKSLLRSNHSTFDTATSVGLSGSGRLHDMFLRWEAMSPGTYASGGKGLTIFWGDFQSPFGPTLVMGTDRGICGLAFTGETGLDTALSDMTARWPNAEFVEDRGALTVWVEQVFSSKHTTSTPLVMIGSPLQIKVWEALLQIPSGYVTTYSDIARLVGSPKAVRAVGTAVGRNPISMLIPCHRALRKDGSLGGYHWGLPVKRALLAWESARIDGNGAA